jgi:hypothetical protein
MEVSTAAMELWDLHNDQAVVVVLHHQVVQCPLGTQPMAVLAEPIIFLAQVIHGLAVAVALHQTPIDLEMVAQVEVQEAAHLQDGKSAQQALVELILLPRAQPMVEALARILAVVAVAELQITVAEVVAQEL